MAKLAQRERESAAAKGLDELTPAFITEKQKAYREQENAKMLVRDVISFTSRSHKEWRPRTSNERKISCI